MVPNEKKLRLSTLASEKHQRAWRGPEGKIRIGPERGTKSSEESSEGQGSMAAASGERSRCPAIKEGIHITHGPTDRGGPEI